jgi:LysM repeat protein
MKRLFLILVSLPFFSIAQNKPITIEGTSPNFFINHTVAAKENYYSIGRLYNISPKEIAPYNNLVLEKGLSLNQSIKIPLQSTNFLQSGEPATDESSIPVYHIVKDKEGLAKIAASYNKLPLPTIKQWNNLKSESVTAGTKLVVGFLKVKKDLSPLAGMPVAIPPAAPLAKNEVSKADVTDKKITAKEAGKPTISNETLPVVKKPVQEKNTIAKDPTPITKEEQVTNEKVKEKEQKISVSPVPVEINKQSKKFNGGYFKTDFENQERSSNLIKENGVAGIFKSTSGWEDGKLYCLHNTATVGSIIKITSISTRKSVYAKVLDVIPDIKQNESLVIRLSNAAAAELGETDSKFECSVSFVK